MARLVIADADLKVIAIRAKCMYKDLRFCMPNSLVSSLSGRALKPPALQKLRVPRTNTGMMFPTSNSSTSSIFISRAFSWSYTFSDYFTNNKDANSFPRVADAMLHN